jgi:3-oxoadipate enol-lactonase
MAVYSDDEDLAALLKYLKVEKVYIVGLSLGGRIALDFTLAHPEMVPAIVPVAKSAACCEIPDTL